MPAHRDGSSLADDHGDLVAAHATRVADRRAPTGTSFSLSRRPDAWTDRSFASRRRRTSPADRSRLRLGRRPILRPRRRRTPARRCRRRSGFASARPTWSSSRAGAEPALEQSPATRRSRKCRRLGVRLRTLIRYRERESRCRDPRPVPPSRRRGIDGAGGTTAARGSLFGPRSAELHSRDELASTTAQLLSRGSPRPQTGGASTRDSKTVANGRLCTRYPDFTALALRRRYDVACG